MFKENGVTSLEADFLERLDDKKLETMVIEGRGGVNLGETLYLVLLSNDKRIPTNVVNAALKNTPGGSQKYVVSKTAEDWNGIIGDARMRKALKSIMLTNATQAMVLADGYDIEAIQNQQLKLENLQTAFDAANYELSH